MLFKPATYAASFPLFYPFIALPINTAACCTFWAIKKIVDAFQSLVCVTKEQHKNQIQQSMKANDQE